MKHNVAKGRIGIFGHRLISVAPIPQNIPDKKPNKSPMLSG